MFGLDQYRMMMITGMTISNCISIYFDMNNSSRTNLGERRTFDATTSVECLSNIPLLRFVGMSRLCAVTCKMFWGFSFVGSYRIFEARSSILVDVHLIVGS